MNKTNLLKSTELTILESKANICENLTQAQDCGQLFRKIPKLPVQKFCGTVEFPQSFDRITRNSVETVGSAKLSTPRN